MTRSELEAHILETYDVRPDHPFPRDEESGVFRHRDSRKWFALIMRVPYRTVGIPREGLADVLNIKCDPLLIGSLRGTPGFLPAYHMNKDKWITVLLDGTVPDGAIRPLLKRSYDLTSSKLSDKPGHFRVTRREDEPAGTAGSRSMV